MKYIYIYIYIYIHNWSGLRSSFSHHLMLCVLILCKGGGTYSLKSAPYDRFLRNLCTLMTILYTLRVFTRNMLRVSRRRNIFSYFVQLEMPDHTA